MSLLISWLLKAKTFCLKKTSVVILLLGLTLSTTAVHAQEIKTISGKVIVPEKVDVTGITIQNITKKTATITDFNGEFSIKAAINDTLVFSAVQLKKKVLPVTKNVLNSSFIQVPMEGFVNELNEVVVQPYNLSGNLGADAASFEVAPVTAESLGLPNASKPLPTQSERLLQEASKMKVYGWWRFWRSWRRIIFKPYH